MDENVPFACLGLQMCDVNIITNKVYSNPTCVQLRITKASHKLTNLGELFQGGFSKKLTIHISSKCFEPLSCN